MHTSVRSIGPDEAWAMLTRAAHNRPIKRTVVERMAEDMKAGRWRRTHESIALDMAGRLIDGQHRLAAIVKAGVAIELTVTLDVPPEAMLVIDSGLSRKRYEALTIASGVYLGRNLIAAAEVMFMAVNSRRPTVAELEPFLASHRAVIDFAAGLAAGHRRGLHCAPVVAAVAAAAYREDRSRLATFMDRLADGVVDGPHEKAVVLLRTHLLTSHGSTDRKRQALYRKTQRAIMAFIAREPLGVLKSPERSPYPLDGEL